MDVEPELPWLDPVEPVDVLDVEPVELELVCVDVEADPEDCVLDTPDEAPVEDDVVDGLDDDEPVVVWVVVELDEGWLDVVEPVVAVD